MSARAKTPRKNQWKLKIDFKAVISEKAVRSERMRRNWRNRFACLPLDEGDVVESTEVPESVVAERKGITSATSAGCGN